MNRQSSLLDIPAFTEVRYSIERKIKVHQRENNPESEETLKAVESDKESDCRRLLEILMTNKRLTVKEADRVYNIGYLPRRALDLRESGIDVQRTFIGETKIKEYWMAEQEIQRVKGLSEQEIKRLKGE